MSARDTTPFLKYVARRAMRKGSRVRKLRGTGAKPAMVSMVINGQMRRVWVPGAVVLGAAARLLTPGKLAKLPPKPGKGDRWRLVPVDLIERLPPPLQKKMREPPPSIGNIPLCRPATDDPQWRALEAVYKQLFELSPIWDVTGAARVELIDNAIDAELKAYKKSTSDVGGSKTLKSEFDIGRYTEAGQAYTSTPEREIERQEHFDAYEAAKEARRQETEEEYAKLVPALKTYGGQLDDKQRHAWDLICYQPQLTGKEISELSGASEPTVTRRRKWFGVMAAKFFELCEPLDYDGAPADAAPDVAFDAPPDATFDDELAPLGPAEVNPKNTRDGHLEGDIAPLDVAALSLSPAQGDTGDYSEGVLSGHARTRANERLLGGGPGRRRISDSAMDRGYESHKETLEESVCALRVREVKRANSRRRYASTAARFLQQQARESGHDVDTALRLIDEYIEQRLREIDIAAEKNVALFKALFQATVLQDVEGLAWVAPWCTERRYSPNDLFGTTDLRMSTDVSLAGTITGPTPSDVDLLNDKRE